jgi:PAS domain S-box-containing protein
MTQGPRTALSGRTPHRSNWDTGVRAAEDVAARLVVPIPFFLIFLALCTVSVVLSQAGFALRFWLPHTSSLDAMYRVFDPYALFFVSAAYVFAKLGLVVVPYEKGRIARSGRVVLVTWVAGALFYGGLYVLEVKALKPLFSTSRPAFWVERSIARDLLTGMVDDTNAVRMLQPEDLRQSVSKAVLSVLISDSSGWHVDRARVYASLVASGMTPDSAKREVVAVIAGRGLPRRMPSLASRVSLLRRMSVWLAKGVQPWLVGLAGPRDDATDKRDAAPSGHVLRQIVVLFLGFFIVLQRRTGKRSALLATLESVLFVVVIVGASALVALSRLYGFQHSLADEMIAAGFPVALLPLLVFPLYVAVARRAKADKARYDEVIHSIPDLLYETNDRGEVTFLNLGFARMFGYESIEELMAVEGEDVDGRLVLYIKRFWVYPEHREFLITETATRKGRVLDYFCYVRSRRRPPFYLSVDSIWIGKDASGGIRGVGREVTSRVRVFDGFYQTDKNGIITFCDEKFASRFGYTLKDLVGKSIADTLYLDAERWSRSMRAFRDEGKDYMTEVIPSKTKNDEVIAVEFANHLILQGSTPCGIEGTIRAIRVQGVYVIQNDRFVHVDEEFCRIFDYTSKELTGKESYLDIVATDDRDMVKKEVERKLSGVPGRPYEFVGLRKGGEQVRVISDSGRGIYRGVPAVIGYILEARPGRDVLERLRRRERFSAIGEAANDLTHWLGNIVPAISGAVLLIRHNLKDSGLTVSPGTKLGEYLGMIETNARLVARMKRDLMGRPDISSPEEESHLNRLSMAALVQQAIGSLKVPTNVEISVAIPGNVPTVQGQGANLLKIFTYLTRNALDAMPKGGRITITGESRQSTQTFVVGVEDTGDGIKPEHKNRIFMPFWSTKPARSDSGLGLGLWFCRVALEGMNAEIDFYSEPGRGTKFEITFYGLRKESDNG